MPLDSSTMKWCLPAYGGEDAGGIQDGATGRAMGDPNRSQPQDKAITATTSAPPWGQRANGWRGPAAKAVVLSEGQSDVPVA